MASGVMRQVTATVVLIAFATSVTGCSVRKRVETQDIVGEQRDRAVAGEMIIEAVLKTGATIEFEKPGATYSLHTKTIRGRTIDGAYAELDLGEVAYLRVLEVKVGSPRRNLLTAVVFVTVLAALVIIAGVADPDF